MKQRETEVGEERGGTWKYNKEQGEREREGGGQNFYHPRRGRLAISIPFGRIRGLTKSFDDNSKQKYWLHVLGF